MVPTPMHPFLRFAPKGGLRGPNPTPTFACPLCGARDRFFLALEEAAFRVLEDPADTELLLEVLAERGSAELICERCGQAFLAPPSPVPLR